MAKPEQGKRQEEARQPVVAESEAQEQVQE